MNYTDYAYILIFLIAGGLFVFVTLLISRLIAPARPDPMKQITYECGEKPIGISWIQFNIRFYIIALAFIIFDVETILLLPPVVSYIKAMAHLPRNFVFFEILSFVSILLFGLAYLWVKGDLEWIKQVPGSKKLIKEINHGDNI